MISKSVLNVALAMGLVGGAFSLPTSAKLPICDLPMQTDCSGTFQAAEYHFACKYQHSNCCRVYYWTGTCNGYTKDPPYYQCFGDGETSEQANKTCLHQCKEDWLCQ